MTKFQFCVNGVVYLITAISLYAARQKLNEQLGLG